MCSSDLRYKKNPLGSLPSMAAVAVVVAVVFDGVVVVELTELTATSGEKSQP